MTRQFGIIAIALMLFCALPNATRCQSVAAKDVVAPAAYASFDPAARGTTVQLAVVMKIRPGFHVNARQVSAEYLIPTDLRAETPEGFQLGEVTYPKGTLQTFTFSKNKQLNVYTDTVILHVPLKILTSAPVGAQSLTLKLHYQACSTEICLPPVTKEVPATINVVATTSAAKPANKEFFSPN
jgi:DsbC/DsbD-like thiol-disulfide interchange protein